MPFLKVNQPKYLADGEYLINDNNPDSTYFGVSEIPNILTGGKNLIMLVGSSDLLEPSSQIDIEVTDLNGRSIYHEVNSYMEPGTKRRAVSIYIYEHTPQGPAKITIVGVAKKRPNGKLISGFWSDKPNVMWQKQINVLPQRENLTRVILDDYPKINIKEIVREYLVPSGNLTTTMTSSIGTDITYTSNGTGTPFIESSQPYFSTSMASSTIEFTSIVPTLDSNENLVSGTTWTTQINNVVSDTKAYVTTHYKPSIQRTILASKNGMPQYWQGNYAVSGFQIADYNHSYQQAVTWETQSLNYESWAKIDISELNPMSGDLRNIKVYKKPQGMQQYSLVQDLILEDSELLAKDDDYGLSYSIGSFIEQTTIDTFWRSAYVGYSTPIGNPTTVTNSSTWIGGVVISGSENLKTNYDTTREDAYIEFKMNPSADYNGDGINTSGPQLHKGSYTITMKLASQDVDDGIANPKIEIYTSGSAINGIDGSNMNLLDTIITSQATTLVSANSGNNTSQPALKHQKSAQSPVAIGISDQTISSKPSVVIDENTLRYDVDILKSGTGAILFRVYSGRWFISDVSIKASKQTGFTPNHTTAEFRMFNDTQQNDIFDFKFEMFDNIGNKVHTAYTQSLAWQGGNTAMSGDNNTMLGSLTIGEGIIFVGGKNAQ